MEINKLINNLPLGNSSQAVLVTVSSESSVHGTIDVYEKDANDNWAHLWEYPCVVGQKGVSAIRHEGDMTTPEGIFSFVYEFGSAENPGTKMQYRQTKPGDYWSSISDADEYNTWVHYEGDPEARFGHGRYEDLYHEPLYKYSAVLDFNYGPGRVIGKGSAIFFHIAPENGGGTAGCIALAEDPLVKILCWMDPEKAPKICIGTESYLHEIGI